MSNDQGTWYFCLVDANCGEKYLWVFVSQTPKPWGDKGKRHTQKNILMYK